MDQGAGGSNIALSRTQLPLGMREASSGRRELEVCKCCEIQVFTWQLLYQKNILST